MARLRPVLLALAAGLCAESAAVGAALPADPASLARSRPDLGALVLARGGCVVFEYYRKGAGLETRWPVYSVTKSVLSLLVGAAIDRGLMRLDETLPELFAEALAPRVDPLARNVTIRDLLTMTAGFEAARAGAAAAPLRSMLERPMKSPPGDRFAYDGMAADLLSLALSRAIHENALGFARRALLDPLGIRNYAWTSDADGRLFGETNLFLTARDMAKIGLLALEGGRWGDRRIVSEAFVRASVARQDAGGPPLGAAYGYLWWVTRTPAGLEAFFAAGSGGQLVYVVPRLGLVAAVAAQSGADDNLGLIEALATPAAGAPACLARLEPAR
jgi:CubicO group peptidase (beta-lactamase class C family)